MAKKLSDFKKQTRNVNRHKKRGMETLNNIVEKEGWIGAITTAANGETFAGSARLEVATNRFGEDAEPIMVHTTGDRPVIIVRDDIPDANHPKAVRLGIADNRISEINYDADYELLAEISDEIDISDMYDDDELIGDENESETLTNTERDFTPKEYESQYLNSSVRQFVLTYSIEDHDLVLGFFELLINRFKVENNAEALKALAENYE